MHLVNLDPTVKHFNYISFISSSSSTSLHWFLDDDDDADVLDILEPVLVTGSCVGGDWSVGMRRVARQVLYRRGRSSVRGQGQNPTAASTELVSRVGELMSTSSGLGGDQEPIGNGGAHFLHWGAHVHSS